MSLFFVGKECWNVLYRKRSDLYFTEGDFCMAEIVLTVTNENVKKYGDAFLALATWERANSNHQDYEEAKNILKGFCNKIRELGYNPIKMFEDVNDYYGEPIELDNPEGLELLPSEMNEKDSFTFSVEEKLLNDGYTCSDVINEKKREHHWFDFDFDIVIPIEERMEKEIPHDKRTKKLMDFIRDYDFFFGKDLLHPQTEQDEEKMKYFMYLLDEYFANQDK